jgi:phospholipid-binding lipoprotein MlaA
MALAAGIVMLAGCATTSDEANGANDPYEDFNRAMFDFNDKLDKGIFKPIAKAYSDNIPAPVRKMVHNALNYLRTPLILANDILQGDLDRAGNTVSRFVTNGVAGFAGTVDTAADLGVPFHSEDFGQTLAVWGAGEGPYLVLPFFGPTNFRDGFGTIVDSVVDPINVYVDSRSVSFPRTGMNAVDKRADLLDTLDDLERTSLDYYAAIRSLYRQRRNDEIKNGSTDDPVPIPNISFEEVEKKPGGSGMTSSIGAKKDGASGKPQTGAK